MIKLDLTGLAAPVPKFRKGNQKPKPEPEPVVEVANVGPTDQWIISAGSGLSINYEDSPYYNTIGIDGVRFGYFDPAPREDYKWPRFVDTNVSEYNLPVEIAKTRNAIAVLRRKQVKLEGEGGFVEAYKVGIEAKEAEAKLRYLEKQQSARDLQDKRKSGRARKEPIR